MCNRLHTDYEKIAPEGKAYKLVQHIGWPRKEWRGLTRLAPIYNANTDGWIRWDDRREEIRDGHTHGFCFIPTLKGAIKAREQWKDSTGSTVEIVEVDYKQGLGKFTERYFMSGREVDVMLAREFNIIRKVKLHN